MLRPWIEVISKGYIRSNKDIVFNAHTIPQLHTTFDGYVVTYDNVTFHYDISADITVSAYSCTRQDNAKLPYPGSTTNLCGLDISEVVDHDHE